MRIMILGSSPAAAAQDAADFRCYCRELGAAGRARGTSAVLCSLFEDSADLAFLEGMAEATGPGSVEATVFFPADAENQKRFQVVRPTIPFALHPEPVDAATTRSYAFLLCQLMALERCDVVIAVGGRDGSAPMLLRLAESQRKPIVPVTAFGGAAADYYRSAMAQLRNLYDVLADRSRAADVVTVAAGGATRPGSLSRCRVFLSYCRKNAEQADVVEAVLRRHHVEPFRDEEGIKTGEEWQRRIAEELKQTDVFIALWSAEYACSPSCFDEMDAALARYPALEIWLFGLDETEVTFPRARKLQHPSARTREDLVKSLTIRLHEYEAAIRTSRS